MAYVNLVKEDLVPIMKDGKPKLIMHGCNMQGVMGAGFAQEVMKFAPHAYLDYSSWCKVNHKGNTMRPIGSVRVNQQHSVLFFHALTQEFYGTQKRMLNYGALAKACVFVNDYIHKNEEHMRMFGYYKELHMPKIGCGLAGGDWSIVEEILTQCFDEDMHLKVYEK